MKFLPLIYLFTLLCGTLPSAQASSGVCGIPETKPCLDWSTMGGYCYTCNMMSASPWVNPGYNSNPWWWGSGPLMSYQNFYSPGPFVMPGPSYPTPGIAPGYFPGNGMIAAAKPNLYLQGPKGTNFSVQVKFLEKGSNWLAAVPLHGKDGWKGTLGDHGMLQANGSNYAYLFSDYRVFGKNFQDKEGFCAPQKEVIGKMAFALKSADFNDREISDYLEYWSVKLPRSKSYCVYPQDESILNQTAALEISPAPQELRRVLFMVQVEEGLNTSGKLFTKPPLRAWSPKPMRKPSSESLVAPVTAPVVAHEWGVGFLMLPE